MTSLQEDITKLSKIWYQYVGTDHHKDKDCHWYIEKYYSYGEPPYYQAFHWGYIGKDFEGTKCTTLEEAEEELRDTLLLYIDKEIKWVLSAIQKQVDNPEENWYSLEELDRQLKILQGETIAEKTKEILEDPDGYECSACCIEGQPCDVGLAVKVERERIIKLLDQHLQTTKSTSGFLMVCTCGKSVDDYTGHLQDVIKGEKAE